MRASMAKKKKLNNPEIGQGTHPSSILCHGKRNSEDFEVIHSRSTSHWEMPTSVQLEVQAHSNHRTRQSSKTNH